MASKEKASIRTRSKIINAATILFGDRGFSGTTMSQIAKRAGVTAGCVYKHFPSKEDLYYFIPVFYIKTDLPAMEAALFGIEGAIGQLRKFIWDYVKNVTENKEWAKMVFLQLKTSQEFMRTEPYKEVQMFFQKIVSIIKMGQKSGEFTADVNPYFVRVVVLGSVEHIIIRWLLKNCSYDVFDHLNGAFKVIEDGLKVRPHSKPISAPE